MEEQLGHKLFDRGSRTITLTPAGELLRDQIRKIVLMADRAEAELTSVDKPISGNVYTGAGETEAAKPPGQGRRMHAATIYAGEIPHLQRQ